MNDLTDRQRQVLDIIRKRVAAGLPPTIREISEALGLGRRQTQAASVHLKALERKGYITRAAGFARNIRLVHPPACPSCEALRARVKELEALLDDALSVEDEHVG